MSAGYEIETPKDHDLTAARNSKDSTNAGPDIQGTNGSKWQVRVEARHTQEGRNEAL